MTSKTVLKTHQLSIGYPKHIVRESINEGLYSGELVCLIGPNGAGKTTLMRTLAGMLSPIAGHVTLLGDDVTKTPSRTLAQRLSVVLTDKLDVGLLTGYALVALGRHPYTDWTGNLSYEDEKIVRWAVEAVNAEDIATRYVSELSDGERQKLMIARALAQDPALMILDEPTAFLDLPRRVEVMQLLRNLARDTKRAILLSTHDLDLALRNADRIWLMPKNADLQVGAPEDLVLNDAFEQAFASEGVQFDKRTGSFRAIRDHQREINILGEGIRYIWTVRAIERAGYILSETASSEVIIGETSWQLKRGTNSASEEFSSLYDLMTTLEN
ncbi:MAG: ABC transporter ATP-binding protein [Phototrophicaceae bacterium]